MRQKIDPIPSGGGLVGNTQAGIIRNVYSLSTVAGEPVNNGAVLGTGSPAVVQSYFNSELAGPDNEKGIGLTSAAMREQSSFENWDFADVWKIEVGSRWPREWKFLGECFPQSSIGVELCSHFLGGKRRSVENLCGEGSLFPD